MAALLAKSGSVTCVVDRERAGVGEEEEDSCEADAPVAERIAAHNTPAGSLEDSLKGAEPIVQYFDSLISSALSRNGDVRSKDKAEIRRGIVAELTGKA